MSIRHAIVAIALLATAGITVSGTATAQDFAKYRGPYVSGGVGPNQAQDAHTSGTVNTKAKFDSSIAERLALGYAFGSGLRLEGEFAHRYDDGDSVGSAAASGHITANSLLANAIYDIPTGARFIPYVGVGAGLARLDSTLSPVGSGRFSGHDTKFAWQAFVGFEVPLNNTVAFTTDLRYFDAGDPSFNITSGGSASMNYHATTLMVGLRWNFGAPAPAPMVEPVQAPAPAQAPAPKPMVQPKPKPKPAPAPAPSLRRSYLIFFDWDKSNIRPDARKVLDAAADAYKKGHFVKITLTGHADRSGPAPYNMRLSIRRALAAKAVLVQLGIDAKDITTIGKGETDPLVPTADGVREPRNRRVQIVF